MFDFYAISGKDTFTKIAQVRCEKKYEAIKKNAEKEEGKKKYKYYTGKKRYIGGIKI